MLQLFNRSFTLLLIALFCLPGAKSGCGSEESKETIESPVQAVITLLELPTGEVEAELVLISTRGGAHSFVDSAQETELRVPSGAMIPLTLKSPGHYRALSTDQPELSYLAEETYKFQFELEDEEAAGDVSGADFMGVADAPGDKVELKIKEAPSFAGDISLLEWSPKEHFALIKIFNEQGSLIWANFDFRDPDFDGSKWARLKKGGEMELGVEVFPEVGEYKVRLCAVEKVSDFDKSLSPELGLLSGFLIGRCVEETLVVPK